MDYVPTLSILALVALAAIIFAKTKIQQLIGKLLILSIAALILLKLIGVFA